MFLSPAENSRDKKYQEFLISSQRVQWVDDAVYWQMIPRVTEKNNILDFGCGLGYVSFLYAREIQEKNIDAHVYACDSQEELLDMLWKRIVDYKFNKLTPLYIANKDRAVLPNWIPPLDHVLFSFSFSSLENGMKAAENIVQELHPQLTQNAQVHVVEWNPLYSDPLLQKLLPKEKYIAQEKLTDLFSQNSFKIVRHYKITQKGVFVAANSQAPAYAFTAVL